MTAKKCAIRSTGTDEAEGGTPLLIVGVYGHSANAGQARQLQYDLGEDYVALGDWNRTVDENPMATLIANGMVSFGDEPRGTIETDMTIHSNNTNMHHRRCLSCFAFSLFCFAHLPHETDHAVVLFSLEWARLCQVKAACFHLMRCHRIVVD